VVGTTVAVVAVAAGSAAGLGLVPEFGGDDPASRSGGKPPPATAPVTRQNLVDTSTKVGALGYGDTATINGKLTGTVTALPAVGAAIERGKPLYQVDNLPVVLLYGTIPAYRALAPDTKGADVRQFEQNLWDLGYRGFIVDDNYTDATAAATKKWQKAIGLPESARTGSVEVGRVVYAPGVIRVDALKAAVGGDAQPGQAVLTYSGLNRVATVDLETSDQRLAAVGAEVTVRLPDGKTVPGRVTRSQTVVDSGDEDESGKAHPTTKIRVTVEVADQQALTGVDQATVDIAFTAARRDGVLTVPVAALLALAEGGYGVQVVEGAGTRIAAVGTGLFANGRVEVSGGGLSEGTIVGIPS
jgi:hypothetical protein